MMWVILTVVIVAALVGCLIFLVMLLRNSRRANGVVAPRDAVDIDTGLFTQESEPYHGPMYKTFVVNQQKARAGRTAAAWHMQLMDADTGQAFMVHFSDKLVLGRGSFGTFSGTVVGLGAGNRLSRQQFLLRASENGVYISNISNTVPGTINGVPLTGAVALQPGMVMQAGTTRIAVKFVGRSGRHF